jgi:hypothetical protein
MINPLIPLIMSIIKIVDVLKRFTLLQLNFLDSVLMAANVLLQKVCFNYLIISQIV